MILLFCRYYFCTDNRLTFNDKFNTMNSSNNDNALNLPNASSDNADSVNVDGVGRKNTHWHWGFVGAMEVELNKAGCKVDVNPEADSKMRTYYIDLLITLESLPTHSHTSGLVKCLRRFTLCEFKSPGISLTIRDIDRQRLLCLKYYLDNADVSRDEVAAMLVVSHFPYEAFKHLPASWVVEEIES
jgi:hypothetical protein